MDKLDFKVAIICTFLIGIILGLLVADVLGKSNYQPQAIENNCAQYNSTTGEFEWIKK